VDKEGTRDVFADALTPLEPATASGSAGPSSAFETMTTAAAGAHAFTHGLDDVEMAAHERKRKVSKLKDAPVRGRNMQGRKTKEPAIDPAKRVDQFPNESLEVTPGDKLFCRACKTERSIRLSSLNAHLASDAHKAKLKVHFEALDGDEDLTALVTHFFENHPELGTSPEGATLAKETHVYRWRVMESMMYAGIPYAKIDMLRHLLEREGHPLTKATHMGETYIPQIETLEIKRVVKELLQQHFALIFDGTTRLGEAINMVTRSITDGFTIRMRLVAFKTTKVHTNGEALCRLILKTLQHTLGLTWITA
jgi:hypothetical protein